MIALDVWPDLVPYRWVYADYNDIDETGACPIGGRQTAADLALFGIQPYDGLVLPLWMLDALDRDSDDAVVPGKLHWNPSLGCWAADLIDAEAYHASEGPRPGAPIECRAGPGRVPPPHALGEITFLPAAEGGRVGPPSSGYHGIIRYDGQVDEWSDIVLVAFQPDPPEPGETAECAIWFARPDEDWPVIREGMGFTLDEGRRVVAKGSFALINRS